jgi:hypothetical protein
MIQIPACVQIVRKIYDESYFHLGDQVGDREWNRVRRQESSQALRALSWASTQIRDQLKQDTEWLL